MSIQVLAQQSSNFNLFPAPTQHMPRKKAVALSLPRMRSRVLPMTRSTRSARISVRDLSLQIESGSFQFFYHVQRRRPTPCNAENGDEPHEGGSGEVGRGGPGADGLGEGDFGPHGEHSDKGCEAEVDTVGHAEEPRQIES